MKYLKPSGLGLALALVFAVCTAPAFGAGETLSLKTTVKPHSGKLYKEVPKPASMSLSVQIKPPSSATRIDPLKRAVMEFPKDLSYNPNNRRTPVCSDQKLNEHTNLAVGVAPIVDLCPKSVIGTGTAEIYLAKVYQPSALISDPELVIFNGGRDNAGNARMKIYAYSKATNYGILMHGSLTPKGIQDVAIPVLSADSATANFVLSIPGPGLTVSDPGSPGGTRTIKGLDPAYARAKCSTGTWVTGGTFTLGERAFPSGTDAGPEREVAATPYTANCRGLAGRARFGKAKVKGPRKVRRGTRRVFRVTVKNRGTATAKRVKVKVGGSGRGKARTANIAPGKSRTIRVKVKITGRKGSAARFVFQVSGKGARTRAVARGRIAR